mmetsp:Transcript_31672/g.72826  ORF Transcript_31672/g.72826 Transcript_31672/m.72826 type:complete len:276 (-) Transcript_31672:28-855(-)
MASMRVCSRCITSLASLRTFSAAFSSSAPASRWLTSTTSARERACNSRIFSAMSVRSRSSSVIVSTAVFSAAPDSAARPLSFLRFSRMSVTSCSLRVSLSCSAAICEEVSAMDVPCAWAAASSAVRSACKSASNSAALLVSASASTALRPKFCVSCDSCILSDATSCFRLVTIVRSTRRVSLQLGLSHTSSGRTKAAGGALGDLGAGGASVSPFVSNISPLVSSCSLSFMLPAGMTLPRPPTPTPSPPARPGSPPPPPCPPPPPPRASLSPPPPT